MRARRFDWNEARRLRASGMTYKEIGVRFGVSRSAIRLACDETARTSSLQYTAAWQRQGVCIDCGGPCTRTGGLPRHRCTPCADLSRATSVRSDTLRCQKCREWKPDNGFPNSRAEPIRRGRHAVCRGCQAEMRRNARHGRRVPCVGCGGPCSHPDDTRTGTGYCAHCVHRRENAA